jgi:hypothetical protein
MNPLSSPAVPSQARTVRLHRFDRKDPERAPHAHRFASETNNPSDPVCERDECDRDWRIQHGANALDPDYDQGHNCGGRSSERSSDRGRRHHDRHQRVDARSHYEPPWFCLPRRGPAGRVSTLSALVSRSELDKRAGTLVSARRLRRTGHDRARADAAASATHPPKTARRCDGRSWTRTSRDGEWCERPGLAQPWMDGRSWTRTRDLLLIREAL